MDHGVATFPQDGDQSDQLIHVADERLYRLKHANHKRTAEPGSRAAAQVAAAVPTPVAPPISIATVRAPEKPVSEFDLASSAAAKSISQQTTPETVHPATYTIQRKSERVSMAGTNAYAVIGEKGTRRARVLDLGFGGVALELEQEQAEELPDNLLAVLHVPILPPVRVFLRPVWSRSTKEGTFRLGCHFVS
jgi:hypothetical protein